MVLKVGLGKIFLRHGDLRFYIKGAREEAFAEDFWAKNEEIRDKSKVNGFKQMHCCIGRSIVHHARR